MEHQTLPPPVPAGPQAPKPVWDITEHPFCCGQCHGTVGQGEAFRVSRVAKRNGLCEDCSITLDGEAPPAYIEPRTFLDRLHADVAHHRLGQQPATNPMIRPGSQPTVEPRGQRQQRYGVASALRASIDHDYRRRQSGERDE